MKNHDHGARAGRLRLRHVGRPTFNPCASMRYSARMPHARNRLALFALVLCCGWMAGPQAAPPATAPATDVANAADSIGSTRNSVVAFVMPPGERSTLTYLAGAWSDDEVKQLREVAPNVRIITGLNRQTALQHAAEAHAIDAQLVTPEFIAQAPNLVWVQSHSAGVDRYVRIAELVEAQRIVLTNMRAVHGPHELR